MCLAFADLFRHPFIYFVDCEVQYYMDYFLNKSDARRKPFPDGLHIAVLGQSNPMTVEMRGRLRSTSPEEARHALILAIDRDITAGATDDELLTWRHALLSTVVTFTLYSSEDDIFWAATNYRETVGATYEVVYYSTAPPPPTYT